MLFENINSQWIRYQDHNLPLAKPSNVPDMSLGYVQPLSVGLLEYDYVHQNGIDNLARAFPENTESGIPMNRRM